MGVIERYGVKSRSEFPRVPVFVLSPDEHFVCPVCRQRDYSPAVSEHVCIPICDCWDEGYEFLMPWEA